MIGNGTHRLFPLTGYFARRWIQSLFSKASLSGMFVSGDTGNRKGLVIDRQEWQRHAKTGFYRPRGCQMLSLNQRHGDVFRFDLQT